jgi:hypothetical protein
MSGFIDEADRNQGTLLPERLEVYVAEENPVRVQSRSGGSQAKSRMIKTPS